MGDVSSLPPILIDECLPKSFADFFASRGYEVHVVGKSLPSGSPDANVVAAAFEIGAIVVTTDAHFKPLKASNPGYGGKIDRADRIFLRCNHTKALARVEALIDDIEREYRIAKQHGKRFTFQITEETFTVVR